MADSPFQPRKRTMPAVKQAARMTRADSLSSMSEFGKIVPLEQQPTMRAAIAKKRKPGNPFEQLLRALSGN